MQREISNLILLLISVKIFLLKDWTSQERLGYESAYIKTTFAFFFLEILLPTLSL